MGYGLHAVGVPVVGISILKRLVLLTSVGDFNTIESNFSYNNDESWSPAS